MNWRAAGINSIARVHFSEPTFDRIANVLISCQFTPKYQFITRPEERCGPFVEPETPLVTDGEVLPLAAGSLGGRGDFYFMRYGDYLIAMNCTEDQTLGVQMPEDCAGKDFVDLISGQIIHARSLAIAPSTTLILYPNE